MQEYTDMLQLRIWETKASAMRGTHRLRSLPALIQLELAGRLEELEEKIPVFSSFPSHISTHTSEVEFLQLGIQRDFQH